jgi:hypothetical protein
MANYLLNCTLGEQIGMFFIGALVLSNHGSPTRNAALGLGDGSDRTYPDQVVIRRREDYPEENESLTARFSPILTRQIQMSKLHTGWLPYLLRFFL